MAKQYTYKKTLLLCSGTQMFSHWRSQGNLILCLLVHMDINKTKLDGSSFLGVLLKDVHWKEKTYIQAKEVYWQKHFWRQNHNDKPVGVRRIFSRPGSVKTRVPNFKLTKLIFLPIAWSRGYIFAVWAGVRKVVTFRTPAHTAKM